ncbi:MAG: glycosyltransferase [Bacteroidota bacterium]
MRPKIIFTVTNDLTYDQRMIRICHSLATNDFEVLLVGRNKQNSIPLQSKSFQQKRLSLFFQRGKLFYLEYNIRLFFFLLIKPFTIVGSVDLDSLLAGYVASKIKRRTLVFDAHEYFTEVPEVVNRPFTKKVWETLADFTLPKLKYAYTVSAALQDLFTEKYGVAFGLIRNIANTYPTPDLSNPLNLPETGYPVVLYQGVLNEGRGLEAMINAMTKIDRAVLWIAGEGDLSQILRAMVRERKLEKKVHFLGYLTPEHLKLVTQRAAIGLNLLENRGLSYYYSLANKTFDYIQAGVPAIHVNFPEYQRINEQFEIGILVDDLETNTLVTAINRLLKDTTFYQKIQQNCYQAAKLYTWKNEKKRLLRFYQNVLNGGR